MNVKTRRWTIASMMLALVLSAVWAWSAPLMPPRPRLPDDVRSLAGIRKVYLKVEARSVQLREAGLDAEAIREMLGKSLTDAGFELADTEDDFNVPTLELMVLGGGEPRVPDGLCFSSTITLRQPVRIERLDETLRVPTYTRILGALEPRDRFVATCHKVFQMQVSHFIADAHKAVDAQ